MKVKYNIGNTDYTINFVFGATSPSGRNGFSVSLMEEAFRLILFQRGVSANVYSNRPKTLAAKVNDFVVASMQGSLDDVAAYGECTMNIALFAKDAAGFKNANRLAVMQNTATANFPLSAKVTTDDDVLVAEYLIDQYPEVLGDAPDDYGFHCRMILFKTTIKVI